MAQLADTNAIKALYDRSLDFSEERLDSLQTNAGLIEKASEELHFPKGLILATRLKGLVEEYSGNYEDAIAYYLKTLDDARAGGLIEYEIAALSDLAITYSSVKQYEKALDVYRQSLELSKKRKEVSSLISGMGNLGAIYNLLNHTDSAQQVLEEALRLSKEYNSTETLSTIYNNLGNVFFKKHEYKKALEYFNLSRAMHQHPNAVAVLWTDYLNIGDVYLEMGQLDSARFYIESSLKLAKDLNSRSKEASSYALLAKLYERLGQYKKAYQYQQQWYQLDTALVNHSSAAAIAELQERYNAKDREKQNQLLQAAVEREQLQNRNLTTLIFAALIVLILISASLLIYRNSNRELKRVNTIISRQKEALSKLNEEKNSLISIVSHDLSAPFSSIHMWARLLDSEILDPQRQKAAEKIRQAAESGEKLIRHILEVERIGTGTAKLELEDTHLTAYLNHLVEQYQPVAEEKNIRLEGPDSRQPVYLMTDQAILKRIVENLLSNAIKFSPAHKLVQVQVQESSETVDILVSDQGPGIPLEDRDRLFTKYGQLSARPTNGEASTGLGLAIVKRLVQELNGSICYEPNPGGGSLFRVQFKK
jgi:signal transduction histidine kinase